MQKGGLCWLLWATTLCLMLTHSRGQVGSSQGQNPCLSKTTCSECIRTRTCAWCSDPYSTELKRCFQPNKNNAPSCSAKFVHNPSNEFSVAEDRATHKTDGAGEAVQVSPQRVTLRLRPNEPQTFTVKFSQAEDYPIDLYYLMDLSQSMNDDKDLLFKLGDDVAESMKNITSNFRLGFGSFVDKKVMPFVSTVPKKLESPCTDCVAPYGFRNHMRLSEDTKRFSGEVQRAPISGNLDAPEGGFDAIMQAVVCREQIGWREKSRRLLVFSTDAGFHFAGDGKLGGIVEPNDGMCHLDDQGVYTHSTTLDYPSISQVNLKVKQNAINVIFAVTKEQLPIYDKLREHVEGSVAGQLSEDSSNVVDFIKEQYSRISSSVELKDTASSGVKVTYSSQCLDALAVPKQTNQCDGLKVGTEVNFTVEVKVTQCPPNNTAWKQQIKIYPIGINESLILDLEMLCDCPCEHPGHPEYVEHSSRCNTFGTESCGKCKCDASHFGQFCECDSENSAVGGGQVGCRADNASSVDCSGRGGCVCGQCDCYKRTNPLEEISGQYCECDNFSCDYEEGQMCSGPDHGVCSCGKCQCLPGWSGESCSCPEGEDACIEPGKGGAVCSGKGECRCGQCDCREANGGLYQGRYCERLPVTPGRCTEFKECVQCRMYKTGMTEEDCAKNCSAIEPEAVEEAVSDENKQEVVCTYFDEEECRFAYVYGYDSERGRVVIRAQRERVCPDPVYVLGIAAGVIGAIVVVGIVLLLLWKLITTINDRREFAKFKREKMMSKWDTGENPIFKQATSTFANPTYTGQ